MTPFPRVFSRRPAEAGLVYRVTASDTLAPGSWSAFGVTTTIVASTTDTETIEATVPADAPRRFLRLEVEAP